jgi:hypothetical protein
VAALALGDFADLDTAIPELLGPGWAGSGGAAEGECAKAQQNKAFRRLRQARCDAEREAADVARLAGAHGFDAVVLGERELTLWDGRAYRLRRSVGWRR